jgi:hypothetical protein
MDSERHVYRLKWRVRALAAFARATAHIHDIGRLLRDWLASMMGESLDSVLSKSENPELMKTETLRR